MPRHNRNPTGVGARGRATSAGPTCEALSADAGPRYVLPERQPCLTNRPPRGATYASNSDQRP